MDLCLSKLVKNWGRRSDLKFTKIKKIRVNKLWRHDVLLQNDVAVPSDVRCVLSDTNSLWLPVYCVIFILQPAIWSNYLDHACPPRVPILSFRHTYGSVTEHLLMFYFPFLNLYLTMTLPLFRYSRNHIFRNFPCLTLEWFCTVPNPYI